MNRWKTYAQILLLLHGVHSNLCREECLDFHSGDIHLLLSQEPGLGPQSGRARLFL